MSFTCQRFCINPTKRKSVLFLTAMSLAFVSSPKRRSASDRRTLHDHETRSLKMLNKPLGDDLRHDLIGVVDAPPAGEAQRERERCGEVFGRGARELVGLGQIQDRDRSRALMVMVSRSRFAGLSEPSASPASM
jgi:hypothetical protein